MKASELRNKDVAALHKDLGDLLDERMTLRMQGRAEQAKQSHRFGQISRDIARVKTVLREKRAG